MLCPNCRTNDIYKPYREYYLCSRCGVYFLPGVDDAETAEYYTSGRYRGKHKQPNERAHQHRRACNILQYLDAPRAFVDIGSSAGVLLDAVRERYAADCYGVDLDTVLAHDVFADIKEVPVSPDCVTIIHCLEHVPHPLDMLRDTYRKMQLGGQIVIEVPNGDVGSRGFYEGAFGFPHVVMFSPLALQWTMKAAGFEIERIVIHGDGGLVGAPDYYYLLMTGRKAKDAKEDVSS